MYRRKIVISPLLLALLLAVQGFLPTEALAASRPAEWAVPVELEASENFFKVSDELYRAGQPSGEAMREYERLGIRTVINLRGLHSDQSKVRGTRLHLVEIPLDTWAAGTDDNVVAVLQAVRGAEKPVLLHCMHGADRTGMMVAMYRMVEQGWAREAAIAEMRDGGYGFHSMWDNIVKYLEQVDVENVRARLH